MKIIISVSEAFLFDDQCNLKKDNQMNLVKQISELKKANHDVIVVSSGVIPMGKCVTGNKTDIHSNSKVYASIGQSHLSLSYSAIFQEYEIYTSNLLLSIDDLYNSKVKIDVFVSMVLKDPNNIPFIYRNYALEKPKQMVNIDSREYLYRSYSLSMFLYKILHANLMFHVDQDHKVLLNQDSCVTTLDYKEGMSENAFSSEGSYNLWNNLGILGSDEHYKKPIIVTGIAENTSFVEMVEDMSEVKYVKDKKTTTIYA